MENLIPNLMSQAHVSEEELRDKSEPNAEFKEKFSWKYLCYAKKHPACRAAPTHILYGKKGSSKLFWNDLQVCANQIGAMLTIRKTRSIGFAQLSKCDFSMIDTALYLMSALGRNLNFNAVVCAEYFWRRALERLTRKVKFDSQIHRSSRLCR